MMNKLTLIASALTALALGACGDNIDVNRADARDTADADPNAPDAAEGTPDANETPDAATALVTVTTGACPAAATQTLKGVSGMNWEYDADGAGGAAAVTAHTIDIQIDAGDTIEFSTTGQHNFESAPGTATEMQFESGAPAGGGHTACLTFTAAHAEVDIQCQVHPGQMNGTLTVN